MWIYIAVSVCGWKHNDLQGDQAGRLAGMQLKWCQKISNNIKTIFCI